MKKRKKLVMGICLLTAFVVWTFAVRFVDVQPIGPLGSTVGFATLNRFVHNVTGVHMSLYVITDWLGLVPIAVAVGFAVLGVAQWLKRRSLKKVDFTLFVLGGFYVIVIVVFFLFEVLVINYRPILIAGILEASYPSSTTMLVMCVMPTAILQLKSRIRCRVLRQCVITAMTLFIIFMVFARLISGVHWFTDIVGGILLSAGVGALYAEVSQSI